MINPRALQVHELRQQGLTYPQISQQLGINRQYASHLNERAERWVNRRIEWNDGLSTRALTCLGALEIESREDALQAFQSGKLSPSKIRNYGWKTHCEIAACLGLPKPERPLKRPTVCPHCGGKL